MYGKFKGQNVSLKVKKWKKWKLCAKIVLQ